MMDGESEDGEEDPGSLYQIVSLPGLIYACEICTKLADNKNVWKFFS